MKLSILGLAFCAFGLLEANSSLPAPTSIKAKKDETTEITLQRTACLGMCPDDFFVLRIDPKLAVPTATATYIGKSSVKPIGVYTGEIFKTTFEPLAKWITAQHFFDLQDYYEPAGPPEGGPTIISVVRGDKRKTVVHYGITTGGKSVPEELAMIEILIRGVAADILWQRSKSGIRGTVTRASNKVVKLAEQSSSTPFPGGIIRAYPPFSSEAVASQKADPKGKFQILLPPGTYVLVPESGDLYGPRRPGKPKTVAVEPDKLTDVVVNYDTRIR